MSEGTGSPRADGITIAYTAWGDGDPIVIIDGATAYRATTPENAATAELLADEFLVINYDRRGRGESGDTPPYAVERGLTTSPRSSSRPRRRPRRCLAGPPAGTLP
ncbi:MAG: hypothetical protein R2719_03925 [Micropruina sp.]